MINGIAQANVQGTTASAPSDQPYNTLVYDPRATQIYGWGKSANNKYIENGGQWYDNGAQGAGYYRPQNSQELAQSAQQYFANQFRQNIPQTENTLYNQMASGVNQSMNQGIKNVQQNNSRRGLLYGGVNAGQEGAVRAGAASQLAEGRSNINSSVENAANNMDQTAIDTGIAIQQQQQQMQNAIYADAMAKMNMNNGLLGGVASAAGMGIGMYLGAGTPGGAAAGGLLGAQIGRAAA